MTKEKFAEIIDKGECMSTLNQIHNFPWPRPFLKNIACRDEWAKHNFYPSNGLVGEVAFNIESMVYILKINDAFYVPMSRKGIKFISESEFLKNKSSQSTRGMDERQKRINRNWDNLTNTHSVMDQVNAIMIKDFGLHNYNRQWISQNIPQDIIGNRYNQLRAEAPFYCNSSMGIMLNNYKDEQGFRNMISQMVEELRRDTNFAKWSFQNLTNWVVDQTISSISKHNLDKLDPQSVGWWMGVASYIACAANDTYMGKFEQIFLTAWGKFFTNETLGYQY